MMDTIIVELIEKKEIIPINIEYDNSNKEYNLDEFYTFIIPDGQGNYECFFGKVIDIITNSKYKYYNTKTGNLLQEIISIYAKEIPTLIQLPRSHRNSILMFTDETSNVKFSYLKEDDNYTIENIDYEDNVFYDNPTSKYDVKE